MMVDERATVPISVIIPAYNGERFLAETLASVFAQTVRPHEVIVINDGSTDRTAEIARAMGATVYDQPNCGLSASRNAGVARATAPWIAYLDADDLWASDKLERQYAATLVDPSAKFVFTDFWQFNSARRLSESVHEIHRRFVNVRRTQIAPLVWCCDAQDMCELIPRQCVILPSAMLVSRELLLAIGGCDETLTYTEDVELELRILAHTHALFVDIPLLGYRRHDGNATGNRLRMRAGDIDVAERVLGSPDRYLPSTVAWYARHRAAFALKGGRMAVMHGDKALAHRWLGESRDVHALASLGWLLALRLTCNAPAQRLLAFAMRSWFRARSSRTRVHYSNPVERFRAS